MLRRLVSNRNLSRDLIGILLALVIGIGGLIFVFSIPDPFVALAPHIPMLTPQDLPGSHPDTGLGISSAWLWKEKREFHTTLVFHHDTYFAEIGQIIVWYADPREAAAVWNQLNTESYHGQPIVASSRDNDKPASMLFCRKNELPDDPRECWYLAHWEHWYTEVRYWSQLDEDFQSLEMQQLFTRVDQLLMSAPAEPCYGILCTGSGEVRSEGRLVVILVIVIMLVATFLIFLSRARTGKKLNPTVSADTLSISFPQDEPKEESILPLPASEVPISLPKEEPKNAFALGRGFIRFLGVPVMAFVMLMLIIGPLYFYIQAKDPHFVGLEDWYIMMSVVTIGVVSGGALGVRIADASWRQMVVASLISGASVMLLSRFEFAPFHPGPWDNTEHVFNPVVFLIGSALCSVPIFLVPLFDPAVRQKGPAPSTGKLVVSALSLTALLSLLSFVSSDSSLIILMIGIFLSGFFLFIGLISALSAPLSVEGAAFGGLGILLLIMIIPAWLLLGGSWFP